MLLLRPLAVKYLLDGEGTLAQMVEQRTENPCVPGSIPGGTTFKKTRCEPCLFCFSSEGILFFFSAKKNQKARAEKNSLWDRNFLLASWSAFTPGLISCFVS